MTRPALHERCDQSEPATTVSVIRLSQVNPYRRNGRHADASGSWDTLFVAALASLAVVGRIRLAHPTT
jgi:hypothetical protein